MILIKKFNSFWERLSPNVKGFIFILLASATFPIMGTTVKYLTSELHPFQIAFFRCIFGFMAFETFKYRKIESWEVIQLESLK